MSSHATGPRTDSGKERSSLNALKHGLRSERPVLPTEDPAEWDAFRAGVVTDLRPAGTLETELAERVALQLWRLRRAARYEAQVTSDEYELAGQAAAIGPADPALAEAFRRADKLKDDFLEAEEDRDLAGRLPGLRNDAAVEPGSAWELLLLAGFLPEMGDKPPATAGALRQLLARATGLPPAEAMALAAQKARERSEDLAKEVAEAGARLARLGHMQDRAAVLRRHERELLQRAALDRVVRYEAHLSRQLNQAMNLLRQLQAERRARDAEVERETQATPAPRETPAAERAERSAVGSFGSPEAAPSAAPPAPAGGIAAFVRPPPGGHPGGHAPGRNGACPGVGGSPAG